MDDGMRKWEIRSDYWFIPFLGLTQIVGWGSMFYAYGLLMQPMQIELNLSKPVVVGAYSVSLLIAGLLSISAGSVIDRIGGRLLMGCGSLLAAIMLACLSQVQTALELYLVWVGIGAAMSATLYQPAFAVVTQIFGSGYRRAITQLTLFGGLASTAFWPLTQGLLQQVGWRDTWLIFAAANLLLCFPVHICLPNGKRTPHESPITQREKSVDLASALRDPTFYLVTAAITFNALVFAAMSLHLIPILQANGISAASAAWIGALIGPMQIVGRVMETLFGKRVTTRQIGMVAISLLPLSLLFLFFPGKWIIVYIIFSGLYGVSNGIMTIVRGALPAELYGRSSYGVISGAMAMPVQIAIAAGPFVASILYSAGSGYGRVIWALVTFSALGAMLFIYSFMRSRSPENLKGEA